MRSMGFAGYVSVCVQLYCVGFHYLSLHVSALMLKYSIRVMMCLGYYIIYIIGS
jgi:hypothetical protein